MLNRRFSDDLPKDNSLKKSMNHLRYSVVAVGLKLSFGESSCDLNRRIVFIPRLYLQACLHWVTIVQISYCITVSHGNLPEFEDKSSARHAKSISVSTDVS